jgi:sugar phosphate isomerase/epimerase
VDRSLCSLNTITVRSLTLGEVVDQALRRGIPAIAPWRDIVQDLGVEAAGRLVRGSGLHVSSLVRGGLFTAPDGAGRRAAIDDNRRALEEAHALGTETLILVCGGLVGRDLVGSRAMVRDGIEAILPDAVAAGIRLGVEPLHPMMVADRSVIATLGEANDLIDRIGSPQVGVVVDVYHVWWDAALEQEVRRAGPRILGLHVSDWVVPIVGQLSSRGMMGDGCIDLPRIAGWVRSAGYTGPAEIEILSDHWWAQPADAVLDLALERFEACV